jgi:hypothetical protein
LTLPNEVCLNQFWATEHLYSWTPDSLGRLLQRVFSVVRVESVHRFERSQYGFVERKLKTLKTYAIALFYNRNVENEIVAYCHVKA